MSLSSIYLSRKELIAENLENMGVSASSSDGLTTLANKILDIEPSIQGLELNTDVTCIPSSNNATTGTTITFTSTLTATYDDTESSNVDLSGVLTGATIDFYSGDVIIGSAITNNNGIAAIEYTFKTPNIYSVRAVFAGSNNFESCQSNSYRINIFRDFTISSDKTVLNSRDNESTYFVCNTSDGIGGETLSFEIRQKSDNTILYEGIKITDENGECRIKYDAEGYGEVIFAATLDDSIEKTYEIYDADIEIRTTGDILKTSSERPVFIARVFENGVEITDSHTNCHPETLTSSGLVNFHINSAWYSRPYTSTNLGARLNVSITGNVGDSWVLTTYYQTHGRCFTKENTVTIIEG